MTEYLCSPEMDFWKILIILFFEAWLGKTDKTKSGSILELIFNMATFFWPRRKANMETPVVAQATETKAIVNDKEVAKDLHLSVTVIQGGKLRCELTYVKDGSPVDGGVFINLKASEIGGLLIDKLEQLIPGDQTGLAAGLKEALAKQLAIKAG